MRKIFLFILLFSGLIMACNSTKKVGNAANETIENSLLWKIEGEGISQASYLFGTIHIIPKSEFFYPNGTLSAIESTDQMVFEIDVNEMTDPAAQMSLMSKAMMKDGKKLSDLLTEEEYKIIDDHFKSIGMPLKLFERMKPAFLSVFASPDMSPNALQDGEMKSYEMEFVQIANSREMKTAGLETIDFQLSLFDSIPYEEQAKQLVKSIEEIDGEDNTLEELVRLYKNQDLAGMAVMFEGEGKDDMMGNEDKLLYDRNSNWVPQIIKLSKETPSFFAVGAGHLVGEKGVVSLLRKAGYKVTPVQ